MKTQRILAVLVCAALPVGLAACGSDDKVKFVKKSFKITEKDTNDFGFVDTGPKTKLGDQGPEKFSPGDEISFRSDLIRGGKDVGSLIARCAVVSNGTFQTTDAECTGVYDFPEGTLTGQVGGEKFFAADKTAGAITGGTGDYAGATGTFTSPNNENGDTVTTIVVWVPSD